MNPASQRLEAPVLTNARPPSRTASDQMSPLAPPQVRAVVVRLIDEVGRVIVGKRRVLEFVLGAVLTEGAHVLFEDMPGLAKSVMASTLSRASGCQYKRIQFTPDLLPADITGTSVYNQQQVSFEFRPGPIFTNFLLADEINRASPKTQSALLEAMAEKQVSVEGHTHRLSKPFLVLATQNPIEHEGVYPLPEAQLDRFMLKLSMGYPTYEEEMEILRRRNTRRKDDFDVRPVCSPGQIVAMQAASEAVRVDRAIMLYISSIVLATRRHPQLLVGASPRGSLALLKLSKSLSVIRGRDFVTPDDVKDLVRPCLAHRLLLRPEARVRGINSEVILEQILNEIPVPKV